MALVAGAGRAEMVAAVVAVEEEEEAAMGVGVMAEGTVAAEGVAEGAGVAAAAAAEAMMVREAAEAAVQRAVPGGGLDRLWPHRG